MTWLDDLLSAAKTDAHKPAVIIDPDRLADLVSVEALGTVHAASDYLTLRRLWEEHGRHADDVRRPVFYVRSHEFTDPRSVPWDIEQRAVVAEVRWPVSPEWRASFRLLPRDLAEMLAELAHPGRNAQQVASDLMRKGFGVVLPAPSPGAELDAVVRLVASRLVPESLWEHVRGLVNGPLALALAQETPDYRPMQQAWAEWLSLGCEATHAETLAEARGAVASLFASGLLRPVPRSALDLPPWTRVGSSQPSAAERFEALLDERPSPWPPTSVAEWIAAATWWGDVRSAMAAAAPMPGPRVDAAWACWAELDIEFQHWLRTGYPLLFSSTRQYPVTLNQVAPFLARRRLSTGRRQLLILIDGLAFAQWAQLRQILAVDVAEATGCFAMCPTLTSVSRQAALSGIIPADFAETLWTTSKEASRWRAFWMKEGLSANDVGYHLARGEAASNVPALGSVAVAAVVLLAVDEVMHGSELLADAQMHASLAVWVRHAFLDTLVDRAHQDGFEMWVTADHGNIESTPSGRVMEGALVEHAGTRVRLYENIVLRDTARADGIAWDPPALPAGKAPLFAPGRTGYHSGGRKVSHGGLSIDEVIVPFAKVVPR